MSNRQQEYLKNEYFLWLLSIIEYRRINTRMYGRLLSYLFNREFTWVVSHDSNRALDAINLRYEFLNDYGDFDPEVTTSLDDKPCSVLEVLVKLAIDWEHEITYDFHKGDRSNRWFWVMVDNLGLLEYPDSHFDEDIVDEIVSVWLDRRFEKNGIGSPFPVKSGIRDQRGIEIWLQLQDFVLENAEI